MAESNLAEVEEHCKFFLEGKCRFGNECRNFHDSDIIFKSKIDSIEEPLKNFEDVMLTEKKPPMRTATDVLSRLRWDENFSKYLDEYIVGYLDRFLGVIERNFTEFNWDDHIASVDDFSGVLAIPKHRIVYFKFRDIVLWDKSKRIDMIFGSTGNEKFDISKPTDFHKHSESSEDTNHGSYHLCSSAEDLCTVGEMRPVMKPADEVLLKLSWDENIDKYKHEIVVGYLDKIEGKVEVNFSDIVWENDAPSVYNSNGALTTLTCQVSFVRFGDIVLWDESKAIDLMFDSPGNSIIEKFEPIKDCKINQEDYSCDMEKLNLTSDSYEEGENKPSSGSTHANMLFRAAPVRIPLKRQTHFLAIRLNDQNLLKNLSKLLNFIESDIPVIKECLYKPEMLHVTIATLGLYSPDEIKAAIASMKNLMETLNNMLSPPILLDITGLGEFHRKILYAKVSPTLKFENFLKNIRTHLRHSELAVTSDTNWIPHVTLAKTRRGVGHKCKMDKLLSTTLSKFKDDMFGTQIIDNVHFCVIGGPKREDGFYSTLFEIGNLFDEK